MNLGKIESNYIEAFTFLLSRKQRQVQQLRLLSNQQRADQNIGSTLLLTLFNRTLASLYDDKIQVKFLPSQGINQDQINAYNILAQSDYVEMAKAKLDYDLAWDTLFFGRGYLETYQFDKKRKIMKPHVINPLVFGYDPYNENPQQWRYYWKWLTKNKWEINALIKAGKITGIQDAGEIASASTLTSGSTRLLVTLHSLVFSRLLSLPRQTSIRFLSTSATTMTARRRFGG